MNMGDPRTAEVHRKTAETSIEISLNLDGKGEVEVETGIPFLNHMVALLGKHALVDIVVRAKGDLDVDPHHTVEDVGICLGQAFRQALGSKEAIRRYGFSIMPMDEALVIASLDISGRPHLVYDVQVPAELIGSYDTGLTVEFLHAFVNHAAITLHFKMLSGRNAHHVIEAIFKGLAKALDMAIRTDERVLGVPSTKGEL